MITTLDFAPYRLSGAVYGTLLNQRSALAALGDAVNHAPYKAPPRAPVLYIKPRNTLAASGAVVRVPIDAAELEVGACLGVVIGETACRLTLQNARAHIAGYLLVADISVPHDTYYRPSIRFKARDGFCPLAPSVTHCSVIADPNRLTIRTYLDERLVQSAQMSESVRSVEQLLLEVTDFMTLAPGDILATGCAAPAPRVTVGQQLLIEADGLAPLSCSFEATA